MNMYFRNLSFNGENKIILQNGNYIHITSVTGKIRIQKTYNVFVHNISKFVLNILASSASDFQTTRSVFWIGSSILLLKENKYNIFCRLFQIQIYHEINFMWMSIEVRSQMPGEWNQNEEF